MRPQEDATYYTVLEIAETATQSEIKSAYRRLSREYHPDTLPPELRERHVGRDAVESFKLVQEAYGTLSDLVARQNYDRLLAEHRGEQFESAVGAGVGGDAAASPAGGSRAGANSPPSPPPPPPPPPHAPPPSGAVGRAGSGRARKQNRKHPSTPGRRPYQRIGWLVGLVAGFAMLRGLEDLSSRSFEGNFFAVDSAIIFLAFPLAIIGGWLSARLYRVHAALGLAALGAALLWVAPRPQLSQNELSKQLSETEWRSLSTATSSSDARVIGTLLGRWSTDGNLGSMVFSADGTFKHVQPGRTVVGEWRVRNGDLITKSTNAGNQYFAAWSLRFRNDGSIYVSTQNYSGQLIRVKTENGPPARKTQANAARSSADTGRADRGTSPVWVGQTKPPISVSSETTSLQPQAITPTAVIENNERPEPDPNLAPPLPPAHAAVQAGDSSAVFAALLAGAAVDERDATSATPLLRAAWHGQKAIVQLLLAQGASVNATDSAGQTALHLAVTYDHPSVVDALLNAGADPNIRAHHNNDSPFFRAILHGSTEVALAMERRGATLSAYDLKLLETGAKLYPKTIAPTLAALRHRRP